MNWIKPFARVDARSLGLFRILIGLTLLGDLKYRFRYLVDFYTNEGVLPNHNHLFNLRQSGRFVWSALHAFSSKGEATVGFIVIALFYLFFLVGYKTRVFHVLSALAFLSLVARNLLAEGPGEALMLGLLSATVFLPLGSRFSVDSLIATARAATETHSADLRTPLPRGADGGLSGEPGWSPISIGAVVTHLTLMAVFVSFALEQTGPSWADGTALSKAMQVYMIPNSFGFGLRSQTGLLGALTQLLRLTAFAVPALFLVPVATRFTRSIAAGLVAVTGLVYAGLTCYTLFGATLVASSALLLAEPLWDGWANRHQASRRRTVVFDGDCGICFWLAKMARRYDLRHHLEFVANESIQTQGDGGEAMIREGATLPRIIDARGTTEDVPVPSAITPALLESSLVVVRSDGTVATRKHAVAEVLSALPGLGVFGLGVTNLLYDWVARNRARISQELGFAACGIPEADRRGPQKEEPPSPARRLQMGLLAVVRETLAVVFLLAFVSQLGRSHVAFSSLPKVEALEGVTWWSRNTTAWSILSPEPPAEDRALVVDALTRDGRAVDPLTGTTPTESFEKPMGLGALWAQYLTRIVDPTYEGYQNAFKNYLTKRGPKFESAENLRFAGADAYWIVGPRDGGETERRRLFRNGRGGATIAAEPQSSRIPEPEEPPVELQSPLENVSPGQDLQ